MDLDLKEKQNNELVKMITNDEDDDAMDEIEALIVVLAKKLKRNKLTKQKVRSSMTAPQPKETRCGVKIAIYYQPDSGVRTKSFEVTVTPNMTLTELTEAVKIGRKKTFLGNSTASSYDVDSLKFNGQI